MGRVGDKASQSRLSHPHLGRYSAHTRDDRSGLEPFAGNSGCEGCAQSLILHTMTRNGWRLSAVGAKPPASKMSRAFSPQQAFLTYRRTLRHVTTIG